MMHKTYVTFGFDHIHRVNGKVYDKDCVAVIQAKDSQEGRALAFEYFDGKFCYEYPERFWSEEKLSFFTRGYIFVNFY